MPRIHIAPAYQQIAAARLINASYVEERTAGTGGVSSESAFQDDAESNSSRKRWRTRRSDARCGRCVLLFSRMSRLPASSSHDANAHSPRAVMLKAEMPNAQPAPRADQQWIVVTTWEQVETPSPNAADSQRTTKAQQPRAANGNPTATGSASASADGSVQPASQPASQITVTRLILKIYPANSVSTQPTASPHPWWLVRASTLTNKINPLER